MLRIGDFASQCNVTVKAVRLYEEKGILKPAYVDQYTGYRYYDGNNVERLMQIMFFKDLGFTLREIKDLSIESIMKKVDVLKKTISEIQTNIEKLEKLSLSSKGELRMKTFINDDRMIGKWENIGAIRDKADLKTIQESQFPFKELYLLPNGEQYWVISWSKGFIRIKDTDHPYEIINNLMYLEVMDLNGEAEFIQVFKQVDHKPYTKQDIRFRDQIH
jgi:DNA-binding transcriptional MerR regulator